MAWEIEFYQKEGGRSPIDDFLNELTIKARAKCLKYIELLAENGVGLPANFARKVTGTKELWELRPEFGGVEYRFLYFIWTDNRMIILHAVTKKSRRLDPNDIDTAEKRIKELKLRDQKKGGK